MNLALAGVESGISPTAALNLGLKVDLDALPQPLIEHLKRGRVNFDDPATTVALIKLNAVAQPMAEPKIPQRIQRLNKGVRMVN